MAEINWNATRQDAAKIRAIVSRASKAGLVTDCNQASIMDLTACHLNGCPLDLAGLLAASDFEFTHDFAGITRHLNRTTGKLKNQFVPRFAQQPAAPAKEK